MQSAVAAAAMSALSRRRVPLLLSLLVATAGASVSESRLLSDLFSDYDRRVRPVANDSDAVQVTIDITVQEVELHLESSHATLNLWLSLTWTDPALRWEPGQYGGVESVRLPPSDLWLPDIMAYNQRPHSDPGWLGSTLVVVQNDGSMLWVSPTSPRVGCRRDFMFPPENYMCSLKLASWSYNGLQINLSSPSVSTDSYVRRDMFWELHTAKANRHEVMYTCCPEPYLDVTMELDLQRSSSLSAWPNLPVAVSLLTSLAAFLVPVDSPQKLTLPSLSLLAAGSAVLTEFGLQGNAEYRSYFLRVYHVYTYIALAVLLWSVLMGALGRPRALRLPSCLRRLLTSCLACICCLASPPEPNSKLCHEWTALAELLDRLAFVVFLRPAYLWIHRGFLVR